MKCLVSNPNIAPHIKETLKSYYEQGLLEKFYTSYYYNPSSKFNLAISKYLPSFNRELQRRAIYDVASSVINSRSIPELIRVFSSKTFSNTTTDRIWEWSELGFDKWVASYVHKNLAWVHTCEHAGLSTLRQAKAFGVMTIHEQPSLHHKFFSEIVRRQISLYPELSANNIVPLSDTKSERRNKRRQAELEKTDYILCNSNFTKRTIASSGIDQNKILTVPLGFPQIDVSKQKTNHDKLVFMYAGNISFPKGIHILLQAWKELCHEKIELWLIGKVNLPNVFLQGLPGNVKFIPNMPHAELLKFYHKADVFIHPTLADGFGMVVTEAMSRGLPVITTKNCGAADFILDKQNGLVIEPECKAAIIEAVNWCLLNQCKLHEMGSKGQQKAATYSWSSYGRVLIENLLGKKKEWDERKKFA